MKNIFKDYTNAINLARSKNYISIIALSVVAFNCNAWDIENQKYSIGLTEKDGHLCYKDKDTNEDTKLTTKDGASLRDSLYNCEKIIKEAYNSDGPYFKNLKNVEQYLPEGEKGKLPNDPAQINGFVLYNLAYRYFKDQISLTALIDKIKLEKHIEWLARNFKFNATDDLKQDIYWYINNEKWGVRHWLENVKQNETTENINRIECYTYDRYLELKDKPNLHVIVDHNTLSGNQIKKLQEAKSNNKIKELKIILTINSITDDVEIYEIPKDVTHVDLSIFYVDEYKDLKCNRKRFGKNRGKYFKDLRFPSSVIDISNPVVGTLPRFSTDNKNAQINIAEDGSNAEALKQLLTMFTSDRPKCIVNNVAVNAEKYYDPNDCKEKIELTFNSCEDLKKAAGNEDVMDFSDKLKKNFGKCKVLFSQFDFAKQSNRDKSIIIPAFATDIDEYCKAKFFKECGNIIVELAKDNSNFGLFEELKEKYGKDKGKEDKVTLSIGKLSTGKRDVTLEKREENGKLYYLCEFDNYKDIEDVLSRLDLDVRLYFKSIADVKTKIKGANTDNAAKNITHQEIKKWIQEKEKECGKKICVRLTEGDISSTDSELLIDEYVTELSYNTLFKGLRQNIKKITFKISTDGRNLELLKTLMENCPGTDIDTKIGEKEIKIDYKDKKLCCDYAKHYKTLDENAAVLKGLIVTFDSYEDIEKTRKDKSTLQFLSDLKKKAKDIEITLTTKGVYHWLPLTIYEYNTKIDEKTIKDINYVDEIEFRIAKNGCNFELLKQLLKSELKDKVKTYIDGKQIGIEIYEGKNGEQYLRCKADDHYEKIVQNKYLQLRELRAYFTSVAEFNGKTANPPYMPYNTKKENEKYIAYIELSSDDVKNEESSITILYCVDSIADGFFDVHKNITDITLENKDFFFKKGSLNACKNLKTIYVPEGVDCGKFKEELLKENTELSKGIEVRHISSKRKK